MSKLELGNQTPGHLASPKAVKHCHTSPVVAGWPYFRVYIPRWRFGGRPRSAALHDDDERQTLRCEVCAFSFGCRHPFVIVDQYGAVRLDLRVRFPRFPIILGLLLMIGCVCVGQTPSGEETGIEGIITISPTQPGPIRADTPGSKPLANTAFVVESQKGQVASFSTDDQGHFRIPLAPGHYTVAIKGRKSSIGHFGPFEADVVSGKMTKVEWQCDSGIR